MAATDPTKGPDDDAEPSRSGSDGDESDRNERDENRAEVGDPSSEDRDRPPAALLEDARETLRVERRRVVDEREALETFRSRVREIPTAAVATDPAPVRYGTRSPGRGLVGVRDAYRETVMSVPHYEAEYDDTYEQSLAAEFGPELAVALTRESTFHDRCRSSLLSAADESIEKRERLLEIVDRESASVSAATSDLRAVVDEVASLASTDHSGEPFGTLDAYRARLRVLSDRCDEIAGSRQRHVTDGEGSARLSDSVPDAQTYLYQDLAVNYPVLAAVARVGSRIESARRRVERAMASGGGERSESTGERPR